MRRMRRPAPIAVVLLMMAWATRTPCASDPVQSGTPAAAWESLSTYLDVVGLYRSGRTGLATVRALGWTRRDIEGFRRALSDPAVSVEVAPAGRGSVSVADIEAAVVLHTEASLAFADVGDGDGAWLHLDSAQLMVNWLEQLSVSRPRLRIRSVLVPRRDWYAAAITALNGVRMPVLAEPLAATALRDYPSDPGVLLAGAVNTEARALIQEQLGELGEQLGTPRRSGRAAQPGRHEVLGFIESKATDHSGARVLRREALGYLSRVLAAEPDNAEARLRSGRLLALVGREDDAREGLAALSVSAAAVEHRYLACLFLGGVHEAAGRLVDAESAYARANGLEPSAQTARVALAHVMLMADRRADAQAVLGPALDPARSLALTSDPFWTYPFGHPVKSRALLEDLRKRVLR